ncbi:2-C-methyl-D-erythritol 4-phosphate cytidylyltransferase [Tuberibacillus calidus]|jgi:2-C-methyl-D-erythritol 4-phosphate cytidylyltransferase|uniref:2-C-methyl-D-erythritol 4-phosphate cytidylyltransferase n=1 Tax=Tuberibacillus calidus TaxID=340097 RepID=UPI00040731A0|nr:2-C-methyl-D-erythritol 4-phosphate cytidylyltransferase [Tuberibacillus calidus]
MGYEVVIPAAGSGKRMGAGHNKLFIELLGKPLIAHTLQVFEEDDQCDEIIVVVKKEEEERIKTIVRSQGFKKRIQFVAGGEERQHSVRHGLMHIKRDGVVLIHDGARPFVPLERISELVKTADAVGAAILAVPVKDTVKSVAESFIEKTVDRSRLWLAQTPQAFRLSVILEAHEKAYREGYVATDDAALVEWIGKQVAVVNGDERNIKITTPEDLTLAEYYILKNKGNRNANRTRL